MTRRHQVVLKTSCLRGSPDPDESAFPLRMAAALWRFWSTRGYVREGLAALRSALACAAAADPALILAIHARAGRPISLR